LEDYGRKLMATLLSIVQSCCKEIRSVASPSTVIGNSDGQIASLLAMANRSGRSLAKDHDWTVLERLHTFATDGTGEYDLPDDYSRLIRQTEWNRSDKDPLVGPTSPQVWQAIKSGSVGASVVNVRFRINRASSGVGRSIYIDPATNTGETLAFEYISNGWCASSDGATIQTAWAADTDIPVLDEDLLTLDLICRWKRSNGLDFASEADELMQIFGVEAGQDRPAPVLNMASGGGGVRYLDASNLPDTGYG